ncbi:MAG: HEPN domain-containing protein [Clostridium chrysemydis]|uniref:HEPN domain-containing protein n=1 Tax=Clostridium chrysemydis TaxID=2665504 RepID=UPI003F33C715
MSIKQKVLKDKTKAKLKVLKKLYDVSEFDEVVSNSGYVAEYGLKASVCNVFRGKEYPDEKGEYRTHDIQKLIKLAKLEQALATELSENLEFFINWSLLTKWDVNIRYKPVGSFDKRNAKNHIHALDDQKGGVYTWIKEKTW